MSVNIILYICVKGENSNVFFYLFIIILYISCYFCCRRLRAPQYSSYGTRRDEIRFGTEMNFSNV